MYSRLIVALTAGFSIGCSNQQYSGDGYLKYNGPFASRNQYILELGTVDQGQFSYRLQGLPSETFTIGLEITTSNDSESFCSGYPLSHLVTLILATEKGEIVINESAPLTEWSWKRARGRCKYESFVYRRGKSKEVDLGDGLSTYRDFNVKPHHGWGSYFLAKTNTEYELKLNIQEQLPTGITANLKATGGGWK